MVVKTLRRPKHEKSLCGKINLFIISMCGKSNLERRILNPKADTESFFCMFYF